MKRFASKSILLTALLASGIASAQSQAASSVTLELFAAKPSESSQAISSLEIGAGGANLKSIEMPTTTSKARFLRANVTDGSGIKSFVYRIIAAPSNGRIFILTSDRKAIALNKFLASTGLEVGTDKTVKLGAQVDFASSNATVMESGSSETMVAGSTTEASTTSTTASTTPVETTTPAATDSSTTGSPPADASATAPDTTTPAADSSTSTPADSSTAATTTQASTPPATAATPDASATPADSSTAPATDSNATPAAGTTPDASATPATDSATPASSSATTTEATALTAPVSTTVGKVELTVIPAGATAPASSEKNLILAPVADATEATSNIQGNMVTLSYTSSSSIDDVAKFYDDQLKAQGFTPDDTSAINQKSADQFVKVYKRGTASMTMSVKNENGTYQVEVDLEGLASGN